MRACIDERRTCALQHQDHEGPLPEGRVQLCDRGCSGLALLALQPRLPQHPAAVLEVQLSKVVDLEHDLHPRQAAPRPEEAAMPAPVEPVACGVVG